MTPDTPRGSFGGGFDDDFFKGGFGRRAQIFGVFSQICAQMVSSFCICLNSIFSKILAFQWYSAPVAVLWCLFPEVEVLLHLVHSVQVEVEADA